MHNTNQLKQTVDTLFGLFEQGEWDEAAKLFSKDAQIIGQYGAKPTVMTLEQFIQNGKHGMLSKLGNPVYLERRLTIIGGEGFVEQHITRLTIHGHVVEFPVCLVGKFDEVGAIALVEEYLDSTPIAAVLAKLQK